MPYPILKLVTSVVDVPEGCAGAKGLLTLGSVDSGKRTYYMPPDRQVDATCGKPQYIAGSAPRKHKWRGRIWKLLRKTWANLSCCWKDLTQWSWSGWRRNASFSAQER